MLSELTIHDLALIEKAELCFGPGLNVITGETGAGKSLLVGSLELLLGETPRGGAGRLVRSGADEARVEGRFQIEEEALRRRVSSYLARELPEIGRNWEESGESELILGRSLSGEGRTRAHINQRGVTLRALRGLAPLLLEIHGQNEHQRLLDPLEQLSLLDVYGVCEKLLGRYREQRDKWMELRERHARLDAERTERRDRLDLLRFQFGELEGADLRVGERAELTAEREILRNAGDLLTELSGLLGTLSEADDATLGRLSLAERTLERWQDVLPKLTGALEDVRTARIHLDEASASIASLRDGIEHDPKRLEATEERLAELERLEHKYGLDEEGLAKRVQEVAASIRELEADEEGLEGLHELISAARESMVSAAQTLRKKRRSVAKKLGEEVQATLAALGLKRARFEVQFAAAGEEDAALFGPRGTETVEFFLAANPGQPPQPLRLVVSGGEAARIMLAVRTVLSAEGDGRTLVFDEIDSGVGGRLGPEVGSHLKQLATRHQVFCVTHLPAIAAAADVHISVYKEVRQGTTRTTIKSLVGEERITEVADMIAGGKNQETARAEARRLLAAAT